MHSYDSSSGLTYFHNGDYSGNVKVNNVSTAPNREGWSSLTDVEIPFEDMKALVLSYYRSRLIRVLEDDDEALERFLFPGLR